MNFYKFDGKAAKGFDFDGMGLMGFIRFNKTGNRKSISFRFGKVAPHSQTWRVRLAFRSLTIFITPDLECPTHISGAV